MSRAAPVLLAAVLVLAACRSEHQHVNADAESTGIENLHHVSTRVYSGAQPYPDDFRTIRDLGVRTIISVDGATPDIERARAAGLRYIHIPIGYEGISNEAAAALRKALLTTDDPVYIHCHHGKHRGPAMAAVALILEGEGDRAEAIAFMETAGTSQGYTGLWRDVRAFDVGDCAGIPVTLHEVAPIEGFAARMALLDRTWDAIKLCEAARWGAPPEHPDIDPPHEALMLLEHLTEAGREVSPDAPYLARGERADFDIIMAESQTAAVSLRDALVQLDTAAADEAFRDLRKSCNDCHAIFRN